MITVLDYGAGNVRSVINAIESLGESVKTVAGADDILSADKLVFPGVGAFGSMMQILHEKEFYRAVKCVYSCGSSLSGNLFGIAGPIRRQRRGPAA